MRKYFMLFAIVAVLFAFTAPAFAQEPVKQAAASDQVKAELVKWIQGLTKAVESGAQLAQEQIPLVLWEVVAYGRAVHTLLALIALGLIAYVLRCIYVLPKLSVVADGYNDDAKKASAQIIIRIVTGILSAFIGCIVFFENIQPAFKAWFAPRLYIIDWLRSFI
jgi:hypothetical protein